MLIELLRLFYKDLDPYLDLPKAQARLARMLATARQDQRHSTAPEPHRLALRLSAQRVSQLVAVYEAGANTRQVAKQFGISATSVKKLLREQGVQARQKSLTAAERLSAVELYQAGETMKVIAEHLGYGVSTIGRALARAGVAARTPDSHPTST